MAKAKAKRKHRFVTGYPLEGGVIIAERGFQATDGRVAMWPMTKFQADRIKKKLCGRNAAIFELVEVPAGK